MINEFVSEEKCTCGDCAECNNPEEEKEEGIEEVKEEGTEEGTKEETETVETEETEEDKGQE
ncbi:MAG: hypothetical protein ABH876_00055 [Patescibacteria group bacterium]|nr:hypothetical protein [Patescibacteria group bacterium]MBU1876835.1 hypothetical protein [Patescibacteria group bacterium]